MQPQRTDLVDGGQEFLHAKGSQGVPGVELGQLSGIDQDGIALRNLDTVNSQNGNLAVLESTCGCRNLINGKTT